MKNKTHIYVFIYLIFLFNSCNNYRDKKVDKSTLLGNDYRLFQDTPAWNLAKAIEDENVNQINQILKKNKELANFREPIFGQSLLHLAIINQDFSSFQCLIENNADIDIHDSYDGTSPLIEACMFKRYNSKYAKLLIEKGANVNDIETGKRREDNSTRYTPLIAAAKSRKMDIIKLLLKKGANINYQNEFDQCALSESLMVDNLDISYFLLKSGADYKRPIFYRPDLSIPAENRLSNDKGEPIYLVNMLREMLLDLDTDEYKYKMKIVYFLKTKGIDYRAVPIPEYIKKKAKDNYPNNWREYLEKY